MSAGRLEVRRKSAVLVNLSEEDMQTSATSSASFGLQFWIMFYVFQY